ncbi:MAG: TauD/TfdA family dioxygenase [Acidimicrobiales bacterium]|nr:TauD/TfdA family dioxygenase [Acidimicrobiales bacterium]
MAITESGPDTLRVTPAAGALGAVVTGLDLRATDESTVAALRELLTEYLVVVVPGQHELTDEAQVALMLQFGEPYLHPIARAMGQTELRAGHIVDDVDHPPFQDQYHTDVSWDPAPPTWGCLRMIERPPMGGDTMFSNMYAAYDALSPAMQRSLEGLTAWHDPGEGKAFRAKSGDAATDAAEQLVPGASHLVVQTHPETGRPYLYVNRGFTRRIEQYTPAESRAVLDLLFAHSENPNFQMRWTWSVGDVVIWDERCTHHFAVADYYPNRREVARVNVR